MGIRFLDSILALLTAAAIVFAAYLVGHALSIDHSGWAWATAGGLMVAAVGLGLLTVRRIRTDAERSGDGTHA